MIRKKLEGLTLDLDHESILEELRFGYDYVSATIGVRNGAIASPLLDFEVQSHDSIIITGDIPITWSNIEFFHDHLKVIRDGEPAIYKITSTIENNSKRKLP